MADPGIRGRLPVCAIATLVMDGPKLCRNATIFEARHTWVARAQLGLQRIHFSP